MWEGNWEVMVVIDGLLKPTAALIVFGGTFGAAMLSFPMNTFTSMPKLIGLALKKNNENLSEIVRLFTRLAEKARREGLLSLEEESQGISDEFIKKGIMLVVDGQDPDVVRDILEIEIEQTRKRHSTGYGLLAAMGGYAPTMGIIGTVMGLIEVLRNLSDPSELGGKVAVAFVATFYGIASANILWLPLGSKLKIKSEEEIHVREIMLEGILAVQAGENPRIIRDKLYGFLPPRLRVSEEEGPARSAQPAA
jgi:chemotaxis protein MotA